jgi:hypothetical protein
LLLGALADLVLVAATDNVPAKLKSIAPDRTPAQGPGGRPQARPSGS